MPGINPFVVFGMVLAVLVGTAVFVPLEYKTRRRDGDDPASPSLSPEDDHQGGYVSFPVPVFPDPD